MSGYDSAGGASSTFGGPSTSTAAGTSNAGGGGGGGTKRRRANADPDFYPGAAPTTKRAQANWKAAQEQAQIRNAQAMQQQQQDAQLANAAGGAGLSQHGGRVHLQADAQHPRQPILSLATLPPEALQRYLSRYGLIDPAGLLSFHHAVFPVPPLPETLHPPLEGRQLNVRKAKMTYVPAARNAKILAARAAAGLPAPGTADEPASNGGEAASAKVNAEAEAKSTAASAAGDATAASTNAAAGGPTDGANSAEGALPASAVGAPPAVPRPAVATSTPSHPWLEPKTPEFAGLSAFDNPDVVLSRLAARATQHWDKRESLKEAETLTNFMFSVRNRGRTLRATPAG